MRASRRALSYALALDIDGVFLKGSNVLPGAREALDALEKKRWPYVFVTNGGGVTELQKARSLTELLGVNVEESQVLMSHTPYRDQVETYRDKRVLILGSKRSHEISKHYGFTHTVVPRQLLAENPTAFHQINVESSSPGDAERRKVQAAFILGDPYEWGLDIQILTDVMLSGPGESQKIPLFACNADIVYNNEHPAPRYTQGAFLEAFRVLYESQANVPLEVQFCGKPFDITYVKVKAMLRERAHTMGVEMPEKFVAIGDSPHSDIKGANMQGSEWSSILLRSGVWQGDMAVLEQDPLLCPGSIQEGILEAIESLS